MRKFYQTVQTVWDNNFHRHHIIPIAVFYHAFCKAQFEIIKHYGFAFRDFSTNGILLPCTEQAALKYRLPLHRGPHRFYNELVLESVCLIFDKYDFSIASENDLLSTSSDLNYLQIHLKAMLRQGRVLTALNNYDPNCAIELLHNRDSMRADFMNMLTLKLENMVPATGFEPVTP